MWSIFKKKNPLAPTYPPAVETLLADIQAHAELAAAASLREDYAEMLRQQAGVKRVMQELSEEMEGAK